MPSKQRILIRQRQTLRNWALSQYPRPSQKTCIAWFLEKYGLKISQSTVSESLSSHFKGLDTANQDRSRLRSGKWPDLEKILYLWQQRTEVKGGVTSGERLRENAQRIWSLLRCRMARCASRSLARLRTSCAAERRLTERAPARETGRGLVGDLE